MRHFIIYLLLITYGNATVQPVMPYMVDAVSHILNYKGHMETVHSHNGKAHVHQEIQDIQKQSKDKQPQSSEKFEKAQKDQIQNDIVSTAIFVLQKQSTTIFYDRQECDALLNNFFPPPDHCTSCDL